MYIIISTKQAMNHKVVEYKVAIICSYNIPSKILQMAVYVDILYS